MSNTPCATEQALNLSCTPNGLQSYSWTGPGGYNANVQNPVIPIINVNASIAGTYTVWVTDLNTCHNTATVNVLVHPKPTIVASGATVCIGQTISLSSSGAGSTASGAFYSWNSVANGGFNAALQNPVITNAVPAMSGIYNVVGTDINSCYNSTSVQVQVNTLPLISVNSGTICLGQQTSTLTASSSNPGTQYTWVPLNGLNTGSGSVVIANPSATGTYTYLVTGTDANQCVGTATTSVWVNPIPVLTTTSAIICVGQQTATLTASSTTAGTAYSWSPATGLSSTIGNSINGTPVATQIYTVNGIDTNTCYGSATATITVNPLPVISVNSGTICLGAQTNLVGAGANTYTWTPALGLSSTTSNAVSASPSVTTTYTLGGTDANTCTNTATATVLVHALPNVQIVPSATAICIGNQDALTASGAVTYTWSPATGLNTTHGITVQANPIIPYAIYTVTATDINNCINSNTVGIVVNALPTVSISPVSPECVPFCATFTASSNPALTAYNWDFGNGSNDSATVSGGTSNIVTVSCFTVAGTYHVKLTVIDINTCINSTVRNLVALSHPLADFDYGPQPVSVLTPEVQFTNQSTPGLPYHSWNFGDPYGHDTSTVNNPMHSYTDVGTYMVTLTVSTANGCSATVVKPIIINEDYALYIPNAFSPNGDGKNETFKPVGEGVSNYKFYIFDRWGLLIFYTEDFNQGWDGRYQGKGDQILQQDVYVWKIQLTDFRNKPKTLNGTVTLLK